MGDVLELLIKQRPGVVHWRPFLLLRYRGAGCYSCHSTRLDILPACMTPVQDMSRHVRLACLQGPGFHAA